MQNAEWVIKNCLLSNTFWHYQYEVRNGKKRSNFNLKSEILIWVTLNREGLWIIKDEVIFVSNLGGKKYLFVQMFQDHFLFSSIFKIFHTWSSYFDFKTNFCNTSCWYSGKDTGLSPGRPQFESLHYQAFLQKAFLTKFFKNLAKSELRQIWTTLQIT